MQYINDNTCTPLKSVYGLLFIAALSLVTPDPIVAQEQSVKSTILSETPKKSGQLITIKGTVSEKELPLPEINIELIGYEWSKTTTDGDGNFEITFPKSLLKKGITLQSSHPGYQINTQEITGKDVKKKGSYSIQYGYGTTAFKIQNPTFKIKQHSIRYYHSKFKIQHSK